MHTLLMITGFLVLGLVALSFLFVLLKIMQSVNDPLGLKDLNLNETDTGDNVENLDSFKIGFNRGIAMAQMSLYKIWVDSGETMVIGSYDNINNEMTAAMTQMLQDVNSLKDWNEKFTKYIKSKNENKDSPE